MEKKNLGIWLSIIISIVLVAILTLTAVFFKNKNLSVYARDAEKMADLMLESADDYSDLIKIIKSGYDTSASSYCVVARNGVIEFEKDNQTTTANNSNKQTVESFLKNKEREIETPADSTFCVGLKDGKTYLVSMRYAKLGDDEINLMICNKESYVVSRMQLDLLIQYVSLFSLLFAIAFVAVTFFQRNQNNKLANSNTELEQKLIKERIQIEELESKAEGQQGKQINDKNCGYMSNSVFSAILGTLTPEQKAASSWIKMLVTDVDEQLRIAVLLDRINTKGIISSRWKKDEFYILVLNRKLDDAKQFVKSFSVRYEKDYQIQMPDLDIQIGEFGGNNEI